MKAPNLYLFNPTGEMAIANGTHSYQAPRLLQEFESALSSLPAFFAQEQDVLLCPEHPLTNDFVNFWQNIGVEMPQSKNLGDALTDEAFLLMKKNELHPWCWSPAIHHQLSTFKEQCSSDFLNQPNVDWKDEFKELYSRKTALKLLSDVIEIKKSGTLLPKQLLPTICNHIEHIEVLVRRWKQIVIKAPWSSSGRGLQVLRHGKLNDAVKQWSSGILKQQGYLMVEPLLDKVLDFAVQFLVKKGEIEFLGISYFSTNSNGLYQENLIGKLPQMEEAVRKELFRQLDGLPELLTTALAKSEIPEQYEGYLGIDALLFLHEGKLKVQPCLEINLRYNMGTLALRMQELIHSKAKGVFRVFFDPKSTFQDFVKQQKKRFSLLKHDHKAFQGFYPMSSVLNKRFGAYLLLE